MSFYFVGEAPLSKSLLNRALIIKSWFSKLDIKGQSQCDDVRIMEQAIQSLQNGESTIHCGLSATALRFLMFRVSRETGKFFLTGESKLLSRPFEDIPGLLGQLGVNVTKTDKGFLIESEGWKPQGDCLYISSQVTSQYASGFILNSWNFPKSLFFVLKDKKISYPYFQMTVDLVKQLGMNIQSSDNEFHIPKNQILKTLEYKPEQDQSCLFALAAFATLKGKATFTNWKKTSWQPDSIFLEILQNMGVLSTLKNDNLTIFKTENLKPISMDLMFYPDLFPVLSVLCAKAEGVSRLSKIEGQVFKESNRLQKTKQLLEMSGIKTEIKNSTFVIYGKKDWPEVPKFSFDVDQDHRMVMAAMLVKRFNKSINIKGKGAVSKSFPSFLSLIGEH